MGEPTVIDDSQALEVLWECVDERGDDYVYTNPNSTGQCHNWHWNSDDPEDEGEPGCIVGLALYKLGVSAKFLKAHYTCGFPSAWLRLDDLAFTNRAKHVLTLAQRAQDQKATWGAAVAVASIAADLATDFGWE